MPTATTRPPADPFADLTATYAAFTDAVDVEAPIDLPDPAREVVVDQTGQPRQAGAELPEGRWVARFRRTAERSLFFFAKAILRRDYLSPDLHKAEADWLQTCPPQRKLLLMPREHCKTTLVSHALPTHILIQPRTANVYFPGEAGREQRILLSGETERRAMDALRTIQDAHESNPMLRAFWPSVTWDHPRRQSKKWNDRELNVRRDTEYPDPSIRAIGVGGAITGAHPTVLIKDDLVTLEAANSPAMMEAAILWHTASRALINDPRALEFIIGTRWAVHDLYEFIEQNDPSVARHCRSVVEDGAPIYPERFSIVPQPGRTLVDDLRRAFGTLFPLLYMNAATDPELTDFVPTDVREFQLVASETGDLAVRFEPDERDAFLTARHEAPRTAVEGHAPFLGESLRGRTLRSLHDVVRGRDLFFRVRYG